MAESLQGDHLPASIAELAERVPGWHGLTLKVTALSGGITNRNFKVEAGGQAYVLRLSGANTDLLGIDRRTELAATLAAAAIGVAPAVANFIEPEGYLVTHFITGQPVAPDEMRLPKTIEQAARLLRQLHQMPPIPGSFSPFQVIRDYRRLAGERGVLGYPADIDGLFERAQDIELALAPSALPPCPCHNDLLNENFLLDSAGQLRLLDWEYAGMGDPYFDLANLAAQHDFGPTEEEELLLAYFGEADPARQARLRLMRIMSDFREAMWGMLQSVVSSLDFDFQGYAARHFRRVTAGLSNTRHSLLA